MKRVYSYEYDRSYNPSIPIVEIKIGQPWTTPLLSLTALVDSGADGTMIPLRYLQQVGARRERKSWVAGVTGVRTQIDIYTVALNFGPFAFDDIEIAAGKQNDEIIVGRDRIKPAASPCGFNRADRRVSRFGFSRIVFRNTYKIRRNAVYYMYEQD